MRFTIDLSLILLASSTAALAAPEAIEERFPRKPPHTRTQCYTSVQSGGRAPATLTTKSYTHYRTCTSTVYNTVTKTTSKHGKYTQTLTSTSTVAAVSTVMPGEGFAPIEDTLRGSDYDPTLDSAPERREMLEEKDSSERALQKKGMHPVEVLCYQYVDKCGKATTKTTTTTVAPSSVPTIKKTKTVTSTTYTSSVYPACATSNFANTYNGATISDVVLPHYRYAINGYFVYYSPSPYDCCVNAMNFPTNTGAGNTTVWLYAQSANEKPICEIPLSDRCDMPEAKDYGVDTRQGGFVEDFVVGNAQCGQFVPRPLPSSSSIIQTSSTAPSSVTPSSTPAATSSVAARL